MNNVLPPLEEEAYLGTPKLDENERRIETAENTSRELKAVFADLSDFQAGELSRLCISRDFFT